MRQEFYDTGTGLSWAVEAESIQYTYDEAMNADWGDGWRLPTIKELCSIIDYNRYQPAIKDGLNCSEDCWFWSASPYVGYPTSAWSVNFYVGYVYDDLRFNTNYVRLVKGAMK